MKNYAIKMVDRLFPICIVAFLIYSLSPDTLFQEVSNPHLSRSARKLQNILNNEPNNNVTNREPQSTSESGSEKMIKLKEFFSVVPISSDNVFLIWPLSKPKLLYRFLCSAESWAFLHPHAKIWYIFGVQQIKDPQGMAKNLLEAYPNIQFIYSDIDKLFEDTPLEKLSKSRAWEASRWPGTHVADFMRQAVVWHKGGYYSDTDVYAFDKFDKARNFLSMSYDPLVQPNYDPKVLHNDDHHPWNYAVMETIAQTYDPDVYAIGGPNATKTTAEKKCGKEFGTFLGDIDRNCTVDGRTIFFPSAKFCPHPCHLSLKKKKTPTLEEYMKKGAKCFHFCNGSSRTKPIAIGSDGLLDNVAKRNCPLVYNQLQEYTNFW